MKTTVCRAIFISNHLKQLLSHSMAEEFWPTFLSSVASVHWGLGAFVYAQLISGHTAVFQSVWGLDLGPLPVILLQICCCSLAAWPSLTRGLAAGQIASCLALKYFGIRLVHTYVWHIVVDSMTARCISAKKPQIITPPPPCFTVCVRRLCCVCFLANVVLCIITKRPPFNKHCSKNVPPPPTCFTLVWKDVLNISSPSQLLALLSCGGI